MSPFWNVSMKKALKSTVYLANKICMVQNLYIPLYLTLYAKLNEEYENHNKNFHFKKKTKYFSIKSNVVATQKNDINETVQLSTLNICNKLSVSFCLKGHRCK